MALDFNEWRKKYRTSTYKEQVEFYNEVARLFPEQIDFHLPSWMRLFQYVWNIQGAFSVLEIGGWKGEMAHEVFTAKPDYVLSWHNIEISEEALKEPACLDPRYTAEVPSDYAWNIELPQANVFIGSHVIEHITTANLRDLLDNLPPTIGWVAFESPLNEQDTERDWENYTGSHILEIGWYEIGEMLYHRGFYQITELNGYNDKEGSQFKAWHRAA